MAYPPVVVFIGGQRLTGYTSMSLDRSKDAVTGSFSADIFFTYMPNKPVVVNAAAGKDVQIYIGGHLAFNGTLDKRMGSGKKKGQPGTSVSTGSVSPIGGSIGPNEYNVRLTGRGRTKVLVDSSHQHPTTNILRPTDKEVVEELLKPFDIQIEWLGETVQLDKVRLRDGARVLDELDRVAIENAHYIYETRDGKLRVTDDIGTGRGEDLILGQNILTFNAEQSEDQANSEITIKGQRTKKDVWGKDAVVPHFKVLKDKGVQNYRPIVVQHYGDATPESLERRGRFEANKRSSLSKSITIEVFHVQTSGEPWDVGTLHYVEVPPEGIFDVFECTGLKYNVQNQNTLSTTLTLSPVPAGSTQGVTGLKAFAGLAASLRAQGEERKRSLGVTFDGFSYPSPWSGPNLVAELVPFASTIVSAVTGLLGLSSFAKKDADSAPLKLPIDFEE